MFILGVFPFRSDAGFEEMVIGFEGKFRNSSNVVLVNVSNLFWLRTKNDGISYVDAPEFFDRVECDDLLEQVVPVVALLNRCQYQMSLFAS